MIWGSSNSLSPKFSIQRLSGKNETVKNKNLPLPGQSSGARKPKPGEHTESQSRRGPLRQRGSGRSSSAGATPQPATEAGATPTGLPDRGRSLASHPVSAADVEGGPEPAG